MAELCMNPYDLCSKAGISYTSYRRIKKAGGYKIATLGKLTQALTLFMLLIIRSSKNRDISQFLHTRFKFHLSFHLYTHLISSTKNTDEERSMREIMAYQAVFKRYEMKYMMTRKQQKAVLEAMLPYMRLDDFGHTQIRNVYFDTDNYRLVRRSIEKPSYKEKLRIRSYEKVKAQDKVFVELKKKYDDVVYKRRESLSYSDFSMWLNKRNGIPFPVDTQIGREIAYFFTYYQTIQAKVFLSYEREAFYALDGSDFRVTFDENILARREALSLSDEIWGERLIDQDCVLMEIKTAGGIPLWMTKVLTQEKLYKTSFSKYGAAYQNMICGVQKENRKIFIA